MYAHQCGCHQQQDNGVLNVLKAQHKEIFLPVLLGRVLGPYTRLCSSIRSISSSSWFQTTVSMTVQGCCETCDAAQLRQLRHVFILQAAQPAAVT